MLFAQYLQVLVHDLARPVVPEEMADHFVFTLHGCEELLFILQILELTMPLLQPLLLLVLLLLQLLLAKVL